MNNNIMEELHKQIIAVQLIQELIVDMCAESGIFTRKDFEHRLSERVAKLNSEIEELNRKLEDETPDTKKTIHTMISPIIGEA